MSLAGKMGPVLCGESGRREVYRFLGKIKITEQTDQSGQDPSQFHPIKGVEQFAHLARGTTTLVNQLTRINLSNGGSMQSAQVVTLKSRAIKSNRVRAFKR